MGYDSKQGLYYSISVNDKEMDFNPSYLSDLNLYHSIFKFFPEVSFSLVNQENFLYQQGIFVPKNDIKIVLGESETDKNLEYFKGLMIDSLQLSDCKSSMNGSAILKIVSNQKQGLITESAAKAWKDKLTSEVIEDIGNTYFETMKIEKTSTKGIWLKPNNQSDREFLRLMKNRSLSADAAPGKMFMWIDLEGAFHFASINTLIAQEPVALLDFTDSDIESYTPTDFDYVNNGVDYDSHNVNDSFREYTFSLEGNAEYVTIDKPDIQSIDGSESKNVKEIDPVSTGQTQLLGYSHSLLSPEYVKAILVNNTYDFPYRFSFIMRNNPVIKPGIIIEMIFPHVNKEELYEESLSGRYLVVGVVKKEIQLIYSMEVHVVSNSQLVPTAPI